jgi:predicted SAM-dependent methyltransferase
VHETISSSPDFRLIGRPAYSLLLRQGQALEVLLAMRDDIFFKNIDRNSVGLEIAPYFNPIAPKRDGFNVIILDVCDTEQLRANAYRDPLIPNERILEIESVDIVGSATEIRELLERSAYIGKLDFIISSHNFEHLANPIKFLQGCYDALNMGGVLTMAVPDARACFDHYRFPTKLSEWLEAFFENRERPSPKQVFDDISMRSFYRRDGAGEGAVGCNFANDTPEHFEPIEMLDECYSRWKKELEKPSSEYFDSHCSTFFNHSLELMLRDLQHLGLIKFEILEVSETTGLEFYVHLKKSDASPPDREAFYKRRHDLLQKINQSLGWAGYEFWKNSIRSEAVAAEAAAALTVRKKRGALKRFAAEAQSFKRGIRAKFTRR